MGTTLLGQQVGEGWMPALDARAEIPS